jgi:protein-S-isoprenylcysteine O-methyltransferase Ste14
MPLVHRIWRFNDWYLHRVPGGAGLMRPRQVINLHKISVGPLTLALMFAAGDFSLAAWLYLALHGVYGILWVAKDIAFGDSSWQRPSSVGSGIAVFFFPLGLYYLPPLLMFTALGTAVPGGWGTTATLPLPLAFAAVVLFLVGAFFHFVSDAQKHYVLEHQKPRRLITDGLFALTRNPNYLGEILMYAAFNLLAQHWLPWVACLAVWLQVFLVNMLHKEQSMARYPEHADWVRRTGFLVPSLTGLLRSLPFIFRDAHQPGAKPR